MNKISFEIRTEITPIVRKAAELLEREIRERSGIAVEERIGAVIILSIRPSIGEEGFSIEDDSSGVVAIVGGDERGLIYGVGKFLRTSKFDDGSCTPSSWRGTSVPKRSVRGIYFASHFFNFYHAAPIERVERYVEDLALWGCNTLAVWFDLHHFHGMADPAAKEMVQRLRRVLQVANTVGISGSLTTVANEGYANSPESLRADWTAGHDGYTSPPGGHYHREICPSREGGLDYILDVRREMLEAFADLDIQYVWIWPYDQGGCTCASCAPWGCNGFLKCVQPSAALIRDLMPQANVVLSTWYFDRFISGEWEGLSQAMGKKKPAYADYLMADDSGDTFPQYPLQYGVPGGLPMLNFPEISMYHIGPWGGYGANPLPGHLQHLWDSCGKHVAGGFPYSEGIFEDMNKAINLQHYWSDRPAMDTVREYAASISSLDGVDDVVAAVEIMEQQHVRSIVRIDGSDTEMRARILPTDGGASKVRLFDAPAWPRSTECLDLLKKAETRMTDHDRKGWRWRLLRLRAEIDVDIQRTQGHSDAISDALFSEVEAISCVEKGHIAVSVPSRQSLVRCLIDNSPEQI